MVVLSLWLVATNNGRLGKLNGRPEGFVHLFFGLRINHLSGNDSLKLRSVLYVVEDNCLHEGAAPCRLMLFDLMRIA